MLRTAPIMSMRTARLVTSSVPLSNSGPFKAILPAQNIICDKMPTLAKLKLKDPRRELALLCSKMDFIHPDSAPPRAVNEILWKSVKGAAAKSPAPHHSLGKAVAGKPADKHQDDI
jgi:hypothetical protein